MKMKVPYHVKGKERRDLAQAISDVLNTVPCYQGLLTQLANVFLIGTVRC